MDMFKMFNEYAVENDMGERDVFEAAMEKRIKEKGYRVSDLCYEVYLAEKRIEQLNLEVKYLGERYAEECVSASLKKKTKATESDCKDVRVKR